MIDLHTHHERCGHAEGSLTDVAGWAMARGIAVLGVSDHAPCLGDPSDQPRQHTQMARSAWDGYLAEAAALRVGLDFVLGSVHEVAHDGGLWSLFDPDSYAGADLDELHARYWRSVAAAAVSGLFDVLAHLDLVRMLPRPAEPPRAAIEDALDAIADTGVAVEINGSGVRRDGRPYPDAAILAGLVRRGVPISFGSDVYRREQLGQGWDEARVLLSKLGVTRVALFRGRGLGWWGGG